MAVLISNQRCKSCASWNLLKPELSLTSIVTTCDRHLAESLRRFSKLKLQVEIRCRNFAEKEPMRSLHKLTRARGRCKSGFEYAQQGRSAPRDLTNTSDTQGCILWSLTGGRSRMLNLISGTRWTVTSKHKPWTLCVQTVGFSICCVLHLPYGRVVC